MLHKGLAMLRAPFPFPLAAGALANYLKLTALRESLSLRDFVAPEALRRPSPPAAGRCKAGISHAARAFSLDIREQSNPGRAGTALFAPQRSGF